MQAGTAKNVIPDHAQVTLDVRTTPTCDNAALLARIRTTVKACVEVISDRFRPIATPADAAIIRAARAALPAATLAPFGGVSDMFFLQSHPDGSVPACLIGPGDGRQSHQPDEFVSLARVRAAAAAYADIATRFWEVADHGH
jgi:acetylornithine deacetylase/succinyl-diaminopimelate desuccinylase-like protein